jgi:hypothetical protein
MDEDTILAAQRGEVSDRRQRHQIQVPAQGVLIATERIDQQLTQLEGDTRARQSLERVCAIGAVRIDDRDRVGQRRVGCVVVRDDDVDALSARLLHRIMSHDAAVAGQDQRCARCGGTPHAGMAEVVAIAHAVRHERLHVSPE